MLISDPGSFKFQFLYTEAPPCPAYCWQKLWLWLLPMGFSRCISSSKASRRWLVLLLAVSSQARLRWLTAQEGSAQPGVLAVAHTSIQSLEAAAAKSSCRAASLETRAFPLPDLQPSHWGRSWTDIPGPGVEVFKKLWWLDHLSHPTLIHTCPQAKRWPPTRWHHQKASGLQFPPWQGTQLNYAEILLVMRSALPI